MVSQALSINMKKRSESSNSKPPGPINIANGTINMALLKLNKKNLRAQP
jgi:hypothetical protein